MCGRSDQFIMNTKKDSLLEFESKSPKGGTQQSNWNQHQIEINIKSEVFLKDIWLYFKIDMINWKRHVLILRLPMI